MGQNLIKPISNPFQNSSFLPPIKNTYSRTEPEETPAPRPSIFATLRKPPVAKANDFIPLFNDCITAASSRTQEYLLFKDPENKFHPSPDVLTQVSTRGDTDPHSALVLFTAPSAKYCRYYHSTSVEE